MNFSLLDLLSFAFSTKSKIFVAVDSSKTLVTLTRIIPERLMQPERIISLAATFLGMLSPVSATVSSVDVPSIISPSTGTFSPGLITIISPTDMLSGFTTNISPFLSTFATSGLMSISCEIDFLLLPSAISSNNSPNLKNSITNTASANS